MTRAALKGIIIGVDLDGVCADFLHRMREIAAEWLERELFKTAPMIPGARRYLRQLSDDGARIRIITHRLYIHFFHKAAVEQTIDWLDKHGIPYWDLCFMKEKEQVGADIYIDDSPSNVEQLRSKGLYTICFANSTNKNISDPRANSWEHVYQLVKDWAANR